MRRKQVNMVYVPLQEQTKPIFRSESIEDTLKEFSHLLSAEIPSDKSVSLGNETNMKNGSSQEKPAGKRVSRICIICILIVNNCFGINKFLAQLNRSLKKEQTMHQRYEMKHLKI